MFLVMYCHTSWSCTATPKVQYGTVSARLPHNKYSALVGQAEHKFTATTQGRVDIRASGEPQTMLCVENTPASCPLGHCRTHKGIASVLGLRRHCAGLQKCRDQDCTRPHRASSHSCRHGASDLVANHSKVDVTPPVTLVIHHTVQNLGWITEGAQKHSCNKAVGAFQCEWPTQATSDLNPM
jgi:hypothetical protein